MLRPSTPGGHPAIGAAWLAGTALALIAIALYGLRSPTAAPLAAIAALVFASGLVAYGLRHARFVGSLGRADRA